MCNSHNPHPNAHRRPRPAPFPAPRRPHPPLPTTPLPRHPGVFSRDSGAPIKPSSPRRPVNPGSPSSPLLRIPHSPNLPRQPAKKIRPSYLSPARSPSGGSGWREIAPPSPPPDSRSLNLAQDSPHRPRNTSSTRAPRPSRARPRSVRRQGWPAQSPTQKKRAPPRLKSFLEKTLTRTNPPHFASQTTPPTHRPAPLTLQGLRLIWRLYEAEAQGVMADLRGLGLDEHRS